MLVCYAFEHRSSWFILAFACSCGLGSAYGFLQGAWPFGLVEAIWAALRCGDGGMPTPAGRNPSYRESRLSRRRLLNGVDATIAGSSWSLR
jgi:hypothetical protein